MVISNYQKMVGTEDDPSMFELFEFIIRAGACIPHQRSLRDCRGSKNAHEISGLIRKDISMIAWANSGSLM